MVSVDTVIPAKVQEAWNDWELRILMILSSSLQIFLMLFSSRRQVTKNKWIIWVIGIAHSLGDWTAAYGVGLVSSSQDGDSSGAGVPDELLPLWASFFLLHLEGADMLTSPPSEDGYLWLKQLVGLVAHVLAILFIFFKSFPNKLLAPTVLVFVAGILKNARRIVSILRQNHENLKDAIGSGTPALNRTRVSETYSEMANANMPMERVHPPKAKTLRDLSSWEMPGGENVRGRGIYMIKVGRILYDTFKGFITKASFSSDDRLRSRKFFRSMSATDAFKILDQELHRMYLALYTQTRDPLSIYASFLHYSSFCALGGSCILLVIVGTPEDSGFDAFLSYALLFMALAQEVLSRVIYDESSSFRASPPCFCRAKLPRRQIDLRKRWSESVCHMNLLSWCLAYHSKLAKLADKVAAAFFCPRDIRDIIRFNLSVSVHPVTRHVKEIIFDELSTKSAVAENIETAVKICCQRGDWALMRNGSTLYSKLKWILGELGYGESLILWHIATELCYSASEVEGIGNEIGERRTFCKIVSDYMFYLLVSKPNMMVSVARDWETVFHNTCERAKVFFRGRAVRNPREACEQILTTFSERVQEGDRSKSVLVDASVLAKQLQSLQGEQWKVMSQVWVELMAYAAFHCEPDTHVQQPCQGGELLTFVWLLMNHLGFGKQIMEEDAPTDDDTFLSVTSLE